jgi:hypothetical protein
VLHGTGNSQGMCTWRVRRHAEGTWQVLTPGGTQACARSTSQTVAISNARALMEYEGAHRLRVEGSASVDEGDRGSPTGDGSAPGLVST